MRTKLAGVVGVVLIVSILVAGVAQAAPDKFGGGLHVVQWGENLASIAFRYGTTVEALVQANGLVDPNYIYIGQQLIVPSTGNVPGNALSNVPQPMTPGGATYTVRYGDTLTSIAMRHGTTAQALMQANGLPNSTIYVGQTLLTPGGAPGQSPAPAMMSGPAAIHQVQAGDTLSAIAFRYGTTVNDIMQVNNLFNPWIFPGQRLTIPSSVAVGNEFPAATFHAVQPGETVAGLSLRYGTTVPAILQANNLSQSGFIFPGQELVIPGKMNSFSAASLPQSPIPTNPPQPSTAGPGPIPAPDYAQPFVGPEVSPDKGIEIAPAAPPGSTSQPMMSQPSGANIHQTAPAKSSGGPLMAAPIVPSTSLPGPAPVPPPAGPSPMGAPSIGIGIQNPTLAPPGSLPPPVVTMKWEGRVVSQTQPEDWKYPSVLRVNVGTAEGMAVTVTKKGSNSWSTTGFTGTKPEYGPGAVEFAPLNPGKHIITLDGQDASITVDIAPNSLTYVEFVQVQADTGP